MNPEAEVQKQAERDEFFNNSSQLPVDQFACKLNMVIPQEFETFITPYDEEMGGKNQPKFKVEELFERLNQPETINKKQKLSLILFG